MRQLRMGRRNSSGRSTAAPQSTSGNPATPSYKLHNDDVIVLAFIAADRSLASLGAPPLGRAIFPTPQRTRGGDVGRVPRRGSRASRPTGPLPKGAPPAVRGRSRAAADQVDREGPEGRHRTGREGRAQRSRSTTSGSRARRGRSSIPRIRGVHPATFPSAASSPDGREAFPACGSAVFACSRSRRRTPTEPGPVRLTSRPTRRCWFVVDLGQTRLIACAFLFRKRYPSTSARVVGSISTLMSIDGDIEALSGPAETVPVAFYEFHAGEYGGLVRLGYALTASRALAESSCKRRYLTRAAVHCRKVSGYERPRVCTRRVLMQSRDLVCAAHRS